MAELPTPQQENGVVALGGELYVVGGFHGFEQTDEVLAFLPEANAWRSVAPLPVPLHHPNAAAIGGRILVAGFLDDLSFTARGDVFAYEPDTDAWSTLATLPEGRERGGGATAVLGDELCIIGGLRGVAVRDVDCLNVETLIWRRLPDLPSPSDHLGAAAIDGVLYKVGGRDSSIAAITTDTYALPPGGDAWERRAPMPTGRGGIAAATLDGEIYVFGGEGNGADPSGVFPQLEIYDPAADAWRSGPAMPSPRHGTGAAAIDGVIYVPGGADRQAFAAVATHEAYTPASFAPPSP